MYLLTMAAANFADFYVRRRLFAPAEPMQTVRNFAAFGSLVRAGIVSDLITLAGSIVLIAALYVILKPVNRTLTFVAVFWWLMECALAALVTLNSLAVFFFVNGGEFSHRFDSSQLGMLAQTFISVDRAGNRIAAIFFGLGSILFCYLWFKSRFIPRALAGWGMLASLVPILAPLMTILFPDFIDAPLRRARSGFPIMIFEVILGLWLLVKGIRMPTIRAE